MAGRALSGLGWSGYTVSACVAPDERAVRRLRAFTPRFTPGGLSPISDSRIDSCSGTHDGDCAHALGVLHWLVPMVRVLPSQAWAALHELVPMVPVLPSQAWAALHELVPMVPELHTQAASPWQALSSTAPVLSAQA